jgi:hypothetical protein
MPAVTPLIGKPCFLIRTWPGAPGILAGFTDHIIRLLIHPNTNLGFADNANQVQWKLLTPIYLVIGNQAIFGFPTFGARFTLQVRARLPQIRARFTLTSGGTYLLVAGGLHIDSSDIR